jgi:enoyl-CoA hydratase/carnithine racemase
LSLVSVDERGDGIVVLALDRPPANAFSPELVAELAKAIAASDGARALVLTSTSPKIFSGGWDLPRIVRFSRDEMTLFVEAYTDLVRRIFVLPVPVVAALPGHAIAGGLIVAAAADERYVADGVARVGLSEVALGVPLPACCLELFRYILGSRAMERLTAAAENVAVESALALRLVDRAVPSADLPAAAVERATTLSRGSPPAYAETKRRARAAALARFDQARDGDPFLDFWFSDDAQKRIHALVARLTEKTGPSSLQS